MVAPSTRGSHRTGVRSGCDTRTKPTVRLGIPSSFTVGSFTFFGSTVANAIKTYRKVGWAVTPSTPRTGCSSVCRSSWWSSPSVGNQRSGDHCGRLILHGIYDVEVNDLSRSIVSRATGITAPTDMQVRTWFRDYANGFIEQMEEEDSQHGFRLGWFVAVPLRLDVFHTCRGAATGNWEEELSGVLDHRDAA